MNRLNYVFMAHISVIVLLFVLQFLVPPFHASMLTRIMVLAAYAAGYNILLGYAGLMSLGHAMFFATGLYTTGLTILYLGFGVPEAFGLAFITSLLMSALMGMITLRTSGAFFLIATMIFSQVFYLSTLYFNQITMGEQGFILAGRLKPLTIGGLTLDLANDVVKYNFALLIFAACLLFSLWLSNSPLGRVFLAIRENEERAEMLGYNTFRYKLLAFTISGTISGIAGSSYALIFSYVGSSLASILYSIHPLLWTLLGGAGTTIGPLIGTGLMLYIIDFTSSITTSYLLVVGIALIVLVLAFPAGIIGAVKRRWLRWLP